MKPLASRNGAGNALNSDRTFHYHTSNEDQEHAIARAKSMQEMKTLKVEMPKTKGASHSANEDFQNSLQVSVSACYFASLKSTVLPN